MNKIDTSSWTEKEIEQGYAVRKKNNYPIYIYLDGTTSFGAPKEQGADKVYDEILTTKEKYNQQLNILNRKYENKEIPFEVFYEEKRELDKSIEPKSISDKQYKNMKLKYHTYKGDDLLPGGSNYDEIRENLEKEGYSVKVYYDTTRVRGMHNYIIFYK